MLKKKIYIGQKSIDNYLRGNNGFIKSDKKIYKHFIKPTLQPIFDEFGLRATDECIYFENKSKMISFIKLALHDILIKRFNEAGITVEVDKHFGEGRSSMIYGTETVFQAKDFHIIEEGDNNEKILSE